MDNASRDAAMNTEMALEKHSHVCWMAVATQNGK